MDRRHDPPTTRRGLPYISGHMIGEFPRGAQPGPGLCAVLRSARDRDREALSHRRVGTRQGHGRRPTGILNLCAALSEANRARWPCALPRRLVSLEGAARYLAVSDW